jgi:hypothetical protein
LILLRETFKCAARGFFNPEKRKKEIDDVEV